MFKKNKIKVCLALLSLVAVNLLSAKVTAMESDLKKEQYGNYVSNVSSDKSKYDGMIEFIKSYGNYGNYGKFYGFDIMSEKIKKGKAVFVVVPPRDYIGQNIIKNLDRGENVKNLKLDAYDDFEKQDLDDSILECHFLPGNTPEENIYFFVGPLISVESGKLYYLNLHVGEEIKSNLVDLYKGGKNNFKNKESLGVVENYILDDSRKGGLHNRDDWNVLQQKKDDCKKLDDYKKLEEQFKKIKKIIEYDAECEEENLNNNKLSGDMISWTKDDLKNGHIKGFRLVFPISSIKALNEFPGYCSETKFNIVFVLDESAKQKLSEYISPIKIDKYRELRKALYYVTLDEKDNTKGLVCKFDNLEDMIFYNVDYNFDLFADEKSILEGKLKFKKQDKNNKDIYNDNNKGSKKDIGFRNDILILKNLNNAQNENKLNNAYNSYGGNNNAYEEEESFIDENYVGNSNNAQNENKINNAYNSYGGNNNAYEEEDIINEPYDIINVNDEENPTENNIINYEENPTENNIINYEENPTEKDDISLEFANVKGKYHYEIPNDEYAVKEKELKDFYKNCYNLKDTITDGLINHKAKTLRKQNYFDKKNPKLYTNNLA